MLNRRHIRVKVMQSIYAFIQSKNDDLESQEKFLKYNIAKTYDLYILILSLLVEVRNLAEKHQEISKKKFLATQADINPSRKFIDLQFLLNLKDNLSLKNYIKQQKLSNWKEDGEYVRIIWDEIKEHQIYINYINLDSTSPKQDLSFVRELYKEVIAPNDKLFDYFESHHLGWVDDLPFVNTWLVSNLQKINASTLFSKQQLFKDKDDEEFATQLFIKVATNLGEFTNDIDSKTPNWDTDRIAEIDLILIKMALCEFTYFKSIPTRVSINEYLEIAKDYSTDKSSFFINGVLDKLLKEFTASKRIEKIGRGLL